MTRLSGSRRAVFVAATFLAVAPAHTSRAETLARSKLASESSAPERVEIALVGVLDQDPPLFERIRSLFPNETAVVLRSAAELDAGAVLRPERADTLYLWIRLSSRARARVYLAAREDSAGAARYLFRDVDLESGLDEVGSETLAQVAHSAAEALWRREEQTPKHQLVEALENEHHAAPGQRAPSVRPEPTVAPAANDAIRDSGVASKSVSRPAPLRLAFGTSFAVHASGAEGWLAEPGIFAATEYRGRFSLRLAGLYLVPTEFDVLPARVHLNGASGELRAGWTPWRSVRARVRLETGLSVLVARWSATIAEPVPAARAGLPRHFVRTSALAASTFEWLLGPAWVAARAELRVPLTRTRYEVERSDVAVSSGAVNPGGGVELGVSLDPTN
jgi:hypothetical protein